MCIASDEKLKLFMNTITCCKLMSLQLYAYLYAFFRRYEVAWVHSQHNVVEAIIIDKNTSFM